MKPASRVAAVHLAVGGLLLTKPRRALRVLGYPRSSASSRSVVRILGARHAAQGLALRRGTATGLWAGAAVDVTHALTCLAYAKHSAKGRRAGMRSAALAGSLAVAQAVLAATGKEAISGSAHLAVVQASQREDPRPDIARVASANPSAWPEPTDERQLILVDAPVTATPVRLAGGVMDGATVTVPPGATSYDVVDAERGKQRYVVTGETDVTGAPIFRLTRGHALG